MRHHDYHFYADACRNCGADMQSIEERLVRACHPRHARGIAVRYYRRWRRNYRLRMAKIKESRG